MTLDRSRADRSFSYHPLRQFTQPVSHIALNKVPTVSATALPGCRNVGSNSEISKAERTSPRAGYAM